MTADEIEQVAKVFVPLGNVTYERVYDLYEDAMYQYWTICDPETGAAIATVGAPADEKGDEIMRGVLMQSEKHLEEVSKYIAEALKARSSFMPSYAAPSPEDIDPLGR